MRAIFFFLSLFLFEGCQPPHKNHPQHEYDPLLFQPCAVLQDYLVGSLTKGRLISQLPFGERPSKVHPFTFFDQQPIWANHLGGVGEGVDKASYAIELFEGEIDFIQSRINEALSVETISAYKTAQYEEYTFSECDLPSFIQNKQNDREEIMNIIKRNEKKEQEFRRASEDYKNKSAENGVDADPSQIRTLYSKMLKEKENYRVVRVSRIGINREEKRAVLYTESQCGPLCGSGSYVVLKLHDHKWSIIGRAAIWIS